MTKQTVANVPVQHTRVYMEPKFKGLDKGDGGIRRVVDAQREYLPALGIEFVSEVAAADVVALHAGCWVDTPKPIVAHAHGLYWEGYVWQRWALALNDDVIRTMRCADAVTAPSKWVAHALARGLWITPEVMYHGVNTDEWPAKVAVASGATEPYVLWNKTRVDAVCDPGYVTRLAELAPDVQFKTTFAHHERNKNVEIVGLQGYEEGKRLVQEANIYLATSRETFGIGTLEAMCSGVPVLGWAWGGQSEFVQHRRHGYLAEPDNYDDLLEGLRYCLQHRVKLGRAARAEVLKHFTWQKRVEPYAELYHRLAREARMSCKVSVVITNYNLGKYLPEAVASVDAARGSLKKEDVQIIVVDDASTEPLPDGVTNNTDITIVHNTQNQYLAEALNTGISLAIGKYIVPLDADNMLAPNALGILAGELDRTRSLDIVYGKMEVRPYSDSGQEAVKYVSDWPPRSANLDQQLAHRNQISSTAMYRRGVWSTVGGYRRRCRTAEDADFWTRALSLGFKGEQVTDAVTLIYRDRKDSMSHTERDWPWNTWYGWASDPVRRSYAAGGKSIPTHEFPQVDVVIPVGTGHERLVLDALDSLYNQTYRHWRAIVVNASGGDIPWLPPWATCVQVGGGSPVGAATARNHGLAEVYAPYVLFLDADDWLQPDALEHMLAIQRDVGGFVYSDWFVGESGEYKQAPEWNEGDVLKQLPYPVTCLYKTEDLRSRSIGFDVDFDGKGWEDWDFALQVVAKGGICGSRVAWPLWHYRIDSSTLRERAYKNRDTLKQQILDKWAPYITGGKPNMASGCGSCGGGRVSYSYNPGGAAASGVPPSTQADGTQGATVLLEYTPDQEDSGGRSFTGRVTGNRYRFSTSGDQKVRKVYETDAEWFLTLGYFKKVPSSPVGTPTVKHERLEALGPPQRVSKSVARPGQAPTPTRVQRSRAAA